MKAGEFEEKEEMVPPPRDLFETRMNKREAGFTGCEFFL